MLDHNDCLGEAVTARLLDFFGDRTSWQRRLWSVGTVMRLKETAEAIELLDPVPAAQHSLEECKASARDLAKVDPGIAAAPERGRIAGLLSAPLTAHGSAHEQLQELVKLSDDGYLTRWSVALRSEQTGLGAESIARLIASHLLDSGSSPGHLYRWWERHTRYNEDETHTLADLLELAEASIVSRDDDFDVVILFNESPALDSRPPGWLDAEGVSAWFDSHRFRPPPQYDGGLRLSFRARDAGAAAQRALDLLDIYAARLAVANRASAWSPMDQAWVGGTTRPIRMPSSRRVDVPVLAREQQLFADERDEQVDSGLQLVSLLDAGTPAAAAAGAWAGLESMLKAPGDGGAHHVAPRLSRIVAGSFCRSELTDLTWRRIRGVRDEISAELKALRTNFERTERMACLVQAGQSGVTDPRDVAGAERMRKILEDPSRSLETVRAGADDALRRLYRQRNLVLHSGRTEAVALRSTLRTAAPLVGAGMDRIAHAWFVDGDRPLRLAARAELQLERLATPDAIPVTRLLAR
ncbi:hypothetical protein [Conexibacter arvalis]|uniref:Uncharacterized protein n=1 Tax=Conexibacter arvalis TaxID=912552 RepID=A0A840IBE4_9ACTN|nr:hypothetical protein [Conexibacter arvalis]MBB4661962.1 hypothetical protein [Conexibacter arvalis]